MTLALAPGARSADPTQPAAREAATERRLPTRREMDLRLAELESRARQLYPRRRDTPLRDLNISDGEVREVQEIARKHRMPEITNISAVVTGCPCEEGGTCTEQVFIVGQFEGRAHGLQLSRRKNAWGIGMVQQWWLEYAALQARKRTMDFRSYMQARDRLLLEFPQCASLAAETSTAQVTGTPAKQ